MKTVYLLSMGKYSAICTSEELAKLTAKRIAVENNVSLKAKIEPYPLNNNRNKITFHEEI